MGLSPEEGGQVRLLDRRHWVAPGGRAVDRHAAHQQDPVPDSPSRRREHRREDGQGRRKHVQDGVQFRADVASEGGVDLFVDRFDPRPPQRFGSDPVLAEMALHAADVCTTNLRELQASIMLCIFALNITHS